VPLLLIISFYTFLLVYSLHCFYWTPSPKAKSTPPHVFAESRQAYRNG
jgi:hypothetical protein